MYMHLLYLLPSYIRIYIMYVLYIYMRVLNTYIMCLIYTVFVFVSCGVCLVFVQHVCVAVCVCLFRDLFNIYELPFV